MATPQAGVIGLSNVVAWPLNTDPVGGTATYGTVFSLAGAAELSFDPAASQTPYFGDDSLIAVGATTGFRKLSVKLYDIDPANLATLMGQTYANGQLLDKGSDTSPYFAIAGQVLRNGGATQPVIFYKCQFMKPKSDWKTKGATINFVEVQLDGATVALTSNGQYSLTQRSDDPSVSASAAAAWYTTPQFTNTDNTALLTYMASQILVVKSVAAGAGTGCTLTWVLTTPGAGFSNNTIVFTGTVTAGAVAADNVTVAVGANSSVKDNNGVSVTAVGKGYLTLA